MRAFEAFGCLFREHVEMLTDIGDHVFETGARHLDAAIAIRERHDADGKRDPGLHARIGAAALRFRAAQPDDLRGSTADIEQNNPMSVGIGKRRTAGRSKPRLRLAVDDFEFEPGFTADTIEKEGSVPGSPARLCGYKARALHAPKFDLVAAYLQRVDRATDRGIAEPLAMGEPLT